MRVDGELVYTLLVGLSVIGVVSLDFEEVFLEDESSISLFLRSPTNSVLSFPISKSISFLLLVVVEGEKGDSG